RDLRELTGLTGGSVAGDSTWLTLGEVIARLRAAEFTESESTVRRLIDEGEIESYRVERSGGRRGHRRMSAASVDALIKRRQSPTREN
ncbi:MAG: helix-turn-helix domain-containing protein, partial [Actinoplanes sp.]